MHARRRRQGGVFAVEFAMLAMLFFIFLFALLEVARAVYLWNLVPEITRRAARAAAVTDFSNASAVQSVREQAVLRFGAGPAGRWAAPSATPMCASIICRKSSGGGGAGGAAGERDAGLSATQPHQLPGRSARRQLHPLRARAAVPARRGNTGGSCERVPYRPILPMLEMLFPSGAQAVRLPSGVTLAVAESLGYQDNPAFCP